MHDLARRLGTWLGIEPDDAEPVPSFTQPGHVRAVAMAAPAPEAVAVSVAVHEPVRLPSGVVDHEIAELRSLVSDLQSGLDQPHDA